MILSCLENVSVGHATFQNEYYWKIKAPIGRISGSENRHGIQLDGRVGDLRIVNSLKYEE
jgi:hypothetical protein